MNEILKHFFSEKLKVGVAEKNVSINFKCRLDMQVKAGAKEVRKTLLKIPLVYVLVRSMPKKNAIFLDIYNEANYNGGSRKKSFSAPQNDLL